MDHHPKELKTDRSTDYGSIGGESKGVGGVGRSKRRVSQGRNERIMPINGPIIRLRQAIPGVKYLQV